jgi:hypothetical protein
MPDRALIRYRAGLLDTESFDMLEAHLMVCPTCQRQLQNLMPPTEVLEPSEWCCAH